MKRLKRRYIALSALVVLTIFFILNYLSQPDVYSPDSSVKNYFGYAILTLQVIFTVVVFKSKSNDTKNILTTLIVLITLSYVVIYFYSAITN